VIQVLNDVGRKQMVVMGEAGRLDPSQFIWVALSAVCLSHKQRCPRPKVQGLSSESRRVIHTPLCLSPRSVLQERRDL
jgi:hypothetical protein